MTSINTNLSAMTALQSLKSTQSNLSKTQGQISTGLRVGEASHNASYWSIATQMKSDNGALSAVKDSIKQSTAMINTFTSALDKSLTYLNKMKEGLVAASQPGADLAKIQTEFDAHIAGLKSAADSAQFNGQNWLTGDKSAAASVLTTKLVTSYDGANNKVGTLDINTADTILFDTRAAAASRNGLLDSVVAIDIGAVAGTATPDAVTTTGTPGGKVEFKLSDLNLVDGASIKVNLGGSVKSYTFTSTDAGNGWNATTLGNIASAFGLAAGDVTSDGTTLTVTNPTNGQNATGTFFNGDIAGALSKVDTAIANVSKASAILGANKALLETQQEFISALSDNLTAGVSAFVDADMNETSTRLQALQTQQQLGVQALSIANQNSQMILRLFQ